MTTSRSIRAPRTVRTLRTAALVASPLVVACGACSSESGGAGREVTRTDSAGVEIVTSPPTDRPLGWSFETVARMGGSETGPDGFTSVGIATFGADAAGNLYVLDGHTSRVVVFTPDGSFLRELGREGSGPGELQFPIGLSVSPSGISSVFDIGKRALVEFGPGGETLPQVAFPHSTEPGVERFFQRTDGGYIVAKGFGGGEGSRDVALVSWSDDVATPDTVSYIRLPLPTPELAMFGCVGLALQPFFAPLMQWAATPDAIAAFASSRYAIEIYRPDGAHVRSVRRGVAPREATPALALAEAGDVLTIRTGAGSCEVSGEDFVEGRGFADVVPAVRNAILAPGGELWVERWEPGTREDERYGPIDVFDPTGAYLGTLPEGTSLPLAILADDRVVVSEKDALDVERLVVLRIDRGS